MLYAILAFFVLAALFLLFRDDHDPSYNKDEKSPRKDPPRIQPQYRQPESAAPKAEKAPVSPSLKEQILGEITQSLQEARDGLKESAQVAREALSEAREAISTTVKEAQEDWEDEDEPDLSFLDNITYFSDLEEETDTFDIAGLRYHCTVHDCGTIIGIVRPEPDNIHDSRAQAVIRSDGKLLGYIPRTQQDWYENFNRTNEECPFVGTIELDRSSARLIGEIKVILPSNEEFVREEIEKELNL